MHYKKEFELLKKLSHPTIIKVHQFIVRESHQSIVLIMELLESVTLGDLIRMGYTFKSTLFIKKEIEFI